MSDLCADLFLESSEQYLAALETIAASDDPLVGMLELSCSSQSAGMQIEFLALANHRKDMQALIAEFGARRFALQMLSLVHHF